MPPKISLLEFKNQPLRLLLRISPSSLISLQQCPLKAIWSSNNKPLLPTSPNAYLGTVIHQILELALQGKINSDQELSDAWELEIKSSEKVILANPVERHLVPLEKFIFNFNVKKYLAFNMIRQLFSDPQMKSGNIINHLEYWVQTSDGKVVGRIDLVKRSVQGIEIIDYKTGSILKESSPDKPKDEYLCQIKLYAALYHAMHGEWPEKLSIIGINQEHFTVAVDTNECQQLLTQAEKSLNDINKLIEDGLNSENIAQPSPEACKYCLFRPSCDKYWEANKRNKGWPVDVKGRIKEKVLLLNGCYRIVVESPNGDITIRGLTPGRHAFLNEEIVGVIFCNLRPDKSEGFFVENMLTTGYVLE